MNGEKVVTSLKEDRGFKIWGMPAHLFVIFGIIMVVGIYTETLPTDIAGSFAIMYFLGIIFNEIGERIPIWNSYIRLLLLLANRKNFITFNNRYDDNYENFIFKINYYINTSISEK